MKLYLYHFLHLYFLSEFEIIFYIYYIMPYEKELILGLLQFDNIMPRYNFSTDSIAVWSDSKCAKYQDRLDKSNIKLWNMCLYYLITINALLFLFFFRDVLQNYVKYTKVPPPSPKYNQKSSLTSFASGQNLVDTGGIELTNIVGRKRVGTEEIRESCFVVYYVKNSAFVHEFCRTLQFVLLVAVFEYLFFKSVVNKYKILDQRTLLCELLKEA